MPTPRGEVKELFESRGTFLQGRGPFMQPRRSNEKGARAFSDAWSVTGGERGIRTLDRIESYTRLAGEHLRPLGQLSGCASILADNRSR